MASWKDLLHSDPLPWLLEADISQPAVRYFALRELLDRPEADPEVGEARKAVMATGPVPAILAAQNAAGYWVKPGPGYGPKYQGTVWQVVFLPYFGAMGSDRRVAAGCEYLLSHNISDNGAFSVNGTCSGFIHCIGGNLGWSLIKLGWLDDPRLRNALEYHARAVTGEGFSSIGEKNSSNRYYKSATCGPAFRCAANMGEPCAWGAVKAMQAMGLVPESERTPAVRKAIAQGASFLLSTDPATADYPHPGAPNPSRSWFQFGYPMGYVTDVLQVLEALAILGYGRDPRLANALELVLSKQDKQGRWKMEYTYNGKMWADIEEKGRPSKWVTLRALRALRAAHPD